MGYFANNTEAEGYIAQYCSKCRHYQNKICPILFIHELWNYEEGNNENSLLHRIIPRKGIKNEQCICYNSYFIEIKPKYDELVALCKEIAGLKQWLNECQASNLDIALDRLDRLIEIVEKLSDEAMELLKEMV